ncbi:hypothetical protein BJ741DRAFT_622541 [Chytriomyces cf. hyalinus JEL632]|nr:hypothetical protein BJ741DRAFT_622541 [Chytriomyces cf. hyalinus JEL632]
MAIARAADILTVAAGLRPCFLNDYFYANPREMSAFLRDVTQQTSFIDCSELCCLLLGDESYFINRKAFSDCDRVPKPVVEGSDLIFVDIGSGLRMPEVANAEHRTSLLDNLETLFNIIQSSIRDPHQLVIETHLPQSSRIPSYSGWLLGYSVIYTFGGTNDDMSAENCLANCPLSVYKVIATVSNGLKQEIGFIESEHMVMSFSIPAHLEIQYPDRDLGREIDEKFAKSPLTSCLFDKFRVVKELVSLPSVVL